ncbi:pyridoxal-phosphate dependent enzyme domain-containing protein [Phthorimaea operculella]|nr:pyridoxal-phosphate dependent enzyme domain-containing protein [Phthorimaea operculella]
MEVYRRDSVAVEFDPMCDEGNPQKISFEDVSAAAFRIQSGITKTPCVKSHMSTIYGMDIYLKNDFLQHTGSFKERGARNALLLLSKECKQRGVITASLGNHSQAMSYHGYLLNIPTTVVMPNVAPIMKIQKCRTYGANVIIHGDSMKEAKFHAMKLAKENNLTYINGYDHPHIMAGQGTVGLEILAQVPEVDAVLVPVGGGGLLAGVATAMKHLKPHVLIYDTMAAHLIILVSHHRYKAKSYHLCVCLQVQITMPLRAKDFITQPFMDLLIRSSN